MEKKFARHERDYKINTHHLMTELLSNQVLYKLLEKEAYEEPYRRA